MLSRLYGTFFGQSEPKKQVVTKFTVLPDVDNHGVRVTMEMVDTPKNEISFLIPLQNFEQEKAKLLAGLEVSTFLEGQIKEAKEQCEEKLYGITALGL